MSHQLSASSGTSSGEVGPLTAIGGFALVFNLIGLYAFTGVALCVFGYIALTLILSSSASKSTRNPGAAEGGNVVMILSWVVALVGGEDLLRQDLHQGQERRVFGVVDEPALLLQDWRIDGPIRAHPARLQDNGHRHRAGGR